MRMFTRANKARDPYRNMYKPRDQTHLERIEPRLQGECTVSAYQASVYQALSEAHRYPDGVVGISLGAIDSALDAGGPPKPRFEKLSKFWGRIRTRVLPIRLPRPWPGPSSSSAPRFNPSRKSVSPPVRRSAPFEHEPVAPTLFPADSPERRGPLSPRCLRDREPVANLAAACPNRDMKFALGSAFLGNHQNVHVFKQGERAASKDSQGPKPTERSEPRR
jgi:hypothetical protein